MATREKLHHFFEESTSGGATLFRSFIILLILLSVGVALIGLIVPTSVEPYLGIIHVFEKAVLGIFTAEYLLRFAAAPHKTKFAIDKYNLIDLIAIAPFYLGITNSTYLRIFRLLRLFRLLKFIRIYEVFRFRGTIIEKITPIVMLLVFLKVIVWILEFEGYWLSEINLGLLFTIIGFSLGIVLSQKISKTYDKFISIGKAMFDLNGKLAGMRFSMNAIKKSGGTKAVKKWLKEFIDIYEGEGNTTRKLDAINEELYRSILKLGNNPLIPHHRFVALVKDIFVDATFILSKREAYTPEVYDRLLQQITLIYLVSLVIFLPGLMGVISILFASYLLYGLYYVTQDLDFAAIRGKATLIRLHPVRLKEYLQTLE